MPNVLCQALSTPVATVPELLFDKKQLIPDLQQLLLSYRKPTS
jgi:hypothetical protein